MSKIDKIDLMIVELLMEDGRMPSAEIARRVGNISERVARYRIERLVSRGIIKISAIPRPKALGFSVIADVFIEVETAHIHAVAERLAKNQCVSYVAHATGEKDVSVQIVAQSPDEVYRFVTEVIGKLPGVRKTTTSIVPLVLKDVHEWHIPRSLAGAGEVQAENEN
jgi:Lrp/AsnC family transcriptional regulator for asnA, asnC and gidA